MCWLAHPARAEPGSRIAPPSPFAKHPLYCHLAVVRKELTGLRPSSATHPWDFRQDQEHPMFLRGWWQELKGREPKEGSETETPKWSQKAKLETEARGQRSGEAPRERRQEARKEIPRPCAAPAFSSCPQTEW